VDETLKVPGFEDVYSIGDCSGYLERTNKTVLPALAQVRSACLTCTTGNPYNYVSLCQY
jgi:NADH dehydrogenase FAD-containing subunit